MKIKEKNILILVSSLGGGGAERVACRLASELSKRHNIYLWYEMHKEQEYYTVPEVHKLFCPTWPGLKPMRAKLKKIKEDGHKEDRHNIGSIARSGIELLKNLYSYYGIFYKVVMVTVIRFKYHIDTTISFLTYPNLINVLAWGNNRKIVSERNDPSRQNRYYQKRAAFAQRKADFVVFQSKKVQKMYSEDMQEKSCIIPNPIEVSCFVSEYKTKKVVTAGRLNKQKNHRMLIEAFALFHTLHPDYHLYIYGVGNLWEALHQATDYYGIKEYVHFEGFKEDIHAAIADAEMFVLSSDYEGLPNALMEAMTMGHACISTACTGADELIVDGKTGLLVPVGDAAALSGAMCRLSDNPELRERLGKAAAIAAQEWATERVARLWERIL